VKGVHRSNLDLDIILTGEEIVFGSKCPGREFPILEGDLVDEENNHLGRIRLQKTATIPVAMEDRDVYFVKTSKELWFVQLGFSAYYELKRNGSITRRIPIVNSQLWIYNPQH